MYRYRHRYFQVWLRKAPIKVFSGKFFKIFTNIIYEEHLRVNDSVLHALSYIMLKNVQTHFKNLAVFSSQDLRSTFGHFSTLCMKESRIWSRNFFSLQALPNHLIRKINIGHMKILNYQGTKMENNFRSYL